jgi:hypothetical protein
MKRPLTMGLCLAFSLALGHSPAAASDDKYDPEILAREQGSEYAKYLAGLFRFYPELALEPVARKPILLKGTVPYRFRSEIRRQTDVKTANFAGQWVLIVVGQGTGAARYFAMNAKTGRVIDAKLATENGLPLFQPNRALLVTGGSTEEKTLAEAKKGAWGGPRAWLWKNSKFKELKL